MVLVQLEELLLSEEANLLLCTLEKKKKILLISEILLCKSGNHSVHKQSHIHHDTCVSSTNISPQAFLERVECFVFCLVGQFFLRAVFGLPLLKTFVSWTWQCIGLLRKALYPHAVVLAWDVKNCRAAKYLRLEWTSVVFWCELSSQCRTNIMPACSLPCVVEFWVAARMMIPLTLWASRYSLWLPWLWKVFFTFGET